MADTTENKPKRAKKPFKEALSIRLAKFKKIATNLKRQAARAGMDVAGFAGIDSVISSIGTAAASLADDFKPKRVALPAEPVAVGAVVELSDAQRERLHDLLDGSVIAGQWKVLKSTADKVQAQSTVDTGVTSFFSRRDVHLPGYAPKPRKQKLDAQGNPLPKAPRKAKGKVAPAAEL